MLTLQNGRPADAINRLEAERQTYDLLDSLGIPYQRLDHAPADTPDLCAEIDRSLHAVICKNLLLCNRRATKFYLLMIPESKSFSGKDLSKQLGAPRLSFAKEETLQHLLHCLPGSASVMGLMHDTDGVVQLVMDQSILKHSHIGCHPCVNTSSIRFPMHDLLDTVLPAIQHPPILVSLP